MKYKATFRVKYRFSNRNNRSGVSWFKQPSVIIEAESIEELLNKAYQLVPNKPNVTAISAIAYVKLGTNLSDRKTIQLDVFREFKEE
jgi:hypothetical protein